MHAQPLSPLSSLLYLNSPIRLFACSPILLGHLLLLHELSFLFFHLALISTLIFLNLLTSLQYCIEITIQPWNVILRMRHEFLTWDSLSPYHPTLATLHSHLNILYKKPFSRLTQTKLCAICISLLPWLLLPSASLLQQRKHGMGSFWRLANYIKEGGKNKMGWVVPGDSDGVIAQPFLFIDKLKWKSQAALSSKCLCCCFLVFTWPL